MSTVSGAAVVADAKARGRKLASTMTHLVPIAKGSPLPGESYTLSSVLRGFYAVPIREFSLIVTDAIEQFQRRSRARVGRDAQVYLVQHAAPEIEEIDRRLESGELTPELLTIGIIQLLESADDGRPLSFILPGGLDDRRFSGIPEFAPLSRNDVARAMEKNCPVFPYCLEASDCLH